MARYRGVILGALNFKDKKVKWYFRRPKNDQEKELNFLHYAVFAMEKI